MDTKRKYSLGLRKSFFDMLFIAIGVIFVWRGVWELINAYLLPTHPLLSNILSIFIGLFILYLPDQDIKALVK